MSVENGFIVKPLSVTDVKQVLGVASNDVGYLCGNGHGNINDFSKHRPMSMPTGLDKPTGLSDEDRAKGNWGWSVSVVDGYAQWTANYPDVSAGYCRLGDFVGYYHSAENCLDLKGENYQYNLITGTSGITLQRNIASHSISFEDFSDNLFLGSTFRYYIESADGLITKYSEWYDLTHFPYFYTVTHEALAELGSGTHKCTIQVMASDGSTYVVCPRGYTDLIVKADVGIAITGGWITGLSFIFGEVANTNGSDTYWYSNPMVLKNWIGFGFAITNNCGTTLNENNVAVKFTWKDSSGSEQTHRSALYGGTNYNSWSLTNGSSTGGLKYVMTNYNDFPTFGTAKEVKICLEVYLTLDETSGIYNWYKITDELTIKVTN